MLKTSIVCAILLLTFANPPANATDGGRLGSGLKDAPRITEFDRQGRLIALNLKEGKLLFLYTNDASRRIVAVRFADQPEWRPVQAHNLADLPEKVRQLVESYAGGRTGEVSSKITQEDEDELVVASYEIQRDFDSAGGGALTEGGRIDVNVDPNLDRLRRTSSCHSAMSSELTRDLVACGALGLLNELIGFGCLAAVSYRFNYYDAQCDTLP